MTGQPDKTRKDLCGDRDEIEDRTPSAQRSASYWLRQCQAAEAERDALRRQVEAVEALCDEAEAWHEDEMGEEPADWVRHVRVLLSKDAT